MEEEKKLPVDVSGARFFMEELKLISRIVVHLGVKKENGLAILDWTHEIEARMVLVQGWVSSYSQRMIQELCL
jgi:hypothetical protein